MQRSEIKPGWLNLKARNLNLGQNATGKLTPSPLVQNARPRQGMLQGYGHYHMAAHDLLRIMRSKDIFSAVFKHNETLRIHDVEISFASVVENLLFNLTF